MNAYAIFATIFSCVGAVGLMCQDISNAPGMVFMCGVTLTIVGVIEKQNKE